MTSPHPASPGFQVTKALSISKHLVRYRDLFSTPLFGTLAALLEMMLATPGWSSSGAALAAGKSLSQIHYFFSRGSWDHRRVNDCRKQVLAQHGRTRSRTDDIACLDETCLAKTGEHFELLDRVHDGRDDAVKPGYRLFGLAIMNPARGIRYVLDTLLVTTKHDNFRSLWTLWMRLVRRNLSRVKALVFVLDAGFRNQYLLRFLHDAGKHFVVRVLGSMVLEAGNDTVKLGEARKRAKRHRVSVSGIGIVEMWCLRGTIRAWKKELPQTLSVLVVQRRGFRNPLILATSQDLPDAEGMARCYGQYLARWSIEVVFKELKLDLGLERFRVRTLRAISRYLAIVVLAHTLLVLKLAGLREHPVFASLLVRILEKTRNLSTLALSGLKKLYEMLVPKIIPFQRTFAHGHWSSYRLYG